MSDSSVVLRTSDVRLFFQREAAEPPDVRALPEMVSALVGLGTGGRAAAAAAEVVASPLAALWQATTQKGNEASWQRLPDHALETLEASPSGVSPADLSFLADMVDRTRPEAVAAVRLLGCLGEDDLVPITQIRALLLDLLEHSDPAVRIAVVEAFWQMADQQVAPQLRGALEEEEHPAVRQTLEHVLRLFA